MESLNNILTNPWTWAVVMGILGILGTAVMGVLVGILGRIGWSDCVGLMVIIPYVGLAFVVQLYAIDATGYPYFVAAVFIIGVGHLIIFAISVLAAYKIAKKQDCL